MRRRTIGWVVGLALGAGCETEDVVEGPPEPALVTPKAPAPRAQSAESYVGVLTQREQADVFAPFTTQVAEVFVKLGERVDKGSLLARLDDSALQDELKIAKAKLREASAASAGAAKQLKIEKRAYHDNVSPKKDFEAAQSAASQASAAAGTQRANVSKLEQQIAKAKIVAERAGTISLLYAQKGGRVTEGQSIIRVSSDDSLIVRFGIPAKFAHRHKTGEPVEFAFEERGARLKGKIKSIAPDLDPVIQKVVAEAEIDPGQEMPPANSKCRVMPVEPVAPAAAGSGSAAAPPPTPAPPAGSAAASGSAAPR